MYEIRSLWKFQQLRRNDIPHGYDRVPAGNPRGTPHVVVSEQSTRYGVTSCRRTEKANTVWIVFARVVPHTVKNVVARLVNFSPLEVVKRAEGQEVRRDNRPGHLSQCFSAEFPTENISGLEDN
ncbi:hypothetical protein CIHG_09720 [Coccidioides immitis H538.4]|uniref:Uncharacterized protein n=1 Tax=Coccidioides immitis H538.4 TaxID=396776 RepID=A0A0J8UVH5_COCIT|nr:hypothetical protein CIHG_09720 [Coccidioides immitis H538.4]